MASNMAVHVLLYDSLVVLDKRPLLVICFHFTIWKEILAEKNFMEFVDSLQIFH